MNTQIVAWIGACTGIASLVWNIYTKLREGPRLHVTASGDLVKMPPPPGNPQYIRITIQNRGTVPTSITNITLHTYPSTWARRRYSKAIFNAVLNDYEGPPYPQPLEVGREWSGCAIQDEKIEGLMDGKSGLWVAVHHSFGKKPTQARVYPVLSQRIKRAKSSVA